MAKTIECWIQRWASKPYGTIAFKDWTLVQGVNWDRLSKVLPVLCEGLPPGASRKLIVTQTKKGIKLEVKP